MFFRPKSSAVIGFVTAIFLLGMQGHTWARVEPTTQAADETMNFVKRGMRFEQGLGVRVDYSEAARCYRAAAESGNTIGMVRLGVMYVDGHGVAQDYKEAARWLQKAVDRNDAGGMVGFGYLYRGVNDEKAVAWYRKAAERGSADGMFYVAEMIRLGKGIGHNSDEEVKWLGRAIDAGSTRAMVYLGLTRIYGSETLARNTGEGLRLLRQAAELGDISGMLNLGYIYERNEETGIGQDYSECLTWYFKAAELGAPLAMTKLGRMYLNGWGTAVDYGEAIKWFGKAAELEHGLAMAYLGTMYRDGLGVAKDRVRASEWFGKAAARDCLWAGDELRKMGQQP